MTAQKREQNLSDVPMSVNAASGDQLARQGVKEPRDLVKLVPGFTYADSYAGTPIYTLRGVGFSDSSVGGRPTVSVYTDEAPIPFAIETIGANLDVERVEVLKGPQGTLFGNNATGGAINFVAAKPTKSFAAGADASYGIYNAVDLSGFVSGPLSDSLLARVALEHRQADGWQTSYTHGGTMGRQDFTNGRLLLVWTPTSQFKAQLNLNGWVDHSETQAPQAIAITPSDPAVAALVPGLATTQLSPQTSRAADWVQGQSYAHNSNFFQANLRLDYVLPHDLTLTSITSYSRSRIFQPAEVDGAALNPAEQLTIGHINSISQELRLAGNLMEKVHFVVGASYVHDNVLEDDYFNLAKTTIGYVLTPFGFPVFEGYHGIDYQHVTTSAVFGSLDYKLTHTVTLSGGVRYTRTDNTFNGCSADYQGDGNMQAVFGNFWNFLRGTEGLAPNPPIPPGGCGTSDVNFVPGMIYNKLNEDNVSWRVGAEWKPLEHTLLYANVSKGYKAGGFPDLGATRDPQFDPARQESLLAYEVGFKTALLDHTLQLNGAAFYYDYRNKQILGRVLDPTLGPLLALVNVPKSDIRGAELQVIWVPVRGLTISSGVSYIDSRVLDNFVNYDPNGVLKNFNHEAFPNTPRWQVVSDVNYTWRLTEGFNGFVGGNVSYQSATNSQLGGLSTLNIKAYSLVDLRAGVETTDGKWRLSLWARNVGNTYYWIAAQRATDTTTRITGMPVTYGLAVSYRLK